MLPSMQRRSRLSVKTDCQEVGAPSGRYPQQYEGVWSSSGPLILLRAKFSLFLLAVIHITKTLHLQDVSDAI